MNKFLFTDSSGNKSLTATVFVWGALIVNLKLILSGMTIMGINLAVFGGSDYGMAMAALGGVYVIRRNMDPAAKSADSSNG